MANQPEQIQYDAGVYQLETTDPVDGGVGAVSNKPLLNVANRTAYLKKHVDDLESGATIPPTVAPLNSPALTGSPTAPTLPLGDNSTKLANSAFVQGTVNGISTINVAGSANVNLTAVQAGAGILVFTGALTGNIDVTVPATSGKWEVSNQTTGAFTLRVKTAAGTGIYVAQGKNTMLWCDGTNVLDAKTDFPSPALTGSPTAPTAASGDNSSSIANTAFVFNATDGMSTVNVAGNVDVTLTQAQYGAALLNLTGALTGNISLKFPQQTGQWVVANNTSGAFAITGKTTAAGTPATVVLPQGSAVIVYSDGMNMYFASSGGQSSLSRTAFTPAAGATSLTVPTGYTVGNLFVEKNGALLEPTTDFTATDGSTIALTKATIAGDTFNVYAFKSFSVANAVQKSGDTMNGPLGLFGGDTGTTAAQFDNSTKLATTAFVQRALGNLAGQNNYSVDTALTAADVGKLVVFNGTNLTLPLASTMPDGAIILVTGNGTNMLVHGSGSDVIIRNGTGQTGNLALSNATMSVFRVLQSKNGWSLDGGDAALPFSPLFGASIGASGYQKLPSGLIIQWGSANGSNSGPQAVTFPIAFPSACCSITSAAVNPSTYAASITTALNATGFSFIINTSLGSSASTIAAMNWMAIGH